MGDNILSLCLGGGVTNFTKGHCFEKKLCYVVVLTTIFQFRLLINYVAVCKLYTTILSINMYLYESVFRRPIHSIGRQIYIKMCAFVSVSLSRPHHVIEYNALIF